MVSPTRSSWGHRDEYPLEGHPLRRRVLEIVDETARTFVAYARYNRSYVNDTRPNMTKGDELRHYAELLGCHLLDAFELCRTSYDRTDFAGTAPALAMPEQLWPRTEESSPAVSPKLNETAFFHEYIEKVASLLAVGKPKDHQPAESAKVAPIPAPVPVTEAETMSGKTLRKLGIRRPSSNNMHSVAKGVIGNAEVALQTALRATGLTHDGVDVYDKSSLQRAFEEHVDGIFVFVSESGFVQRFYELHGAFEARLGLGPAEFDSNQRKHRQDALETAEKEAGEKPAKAGTGAARPEPATPFAFIDLAVFAFFFAMRASRQARKGRHYRYLSRQMAELQADYLRDLLVEHERTRTGADMLPVHPFEPVAVLAFAAPGHITMRFPDDGFFSSLAPVLQKKQEAKQILDAKADRARDKKKAAASSAPTPGPTSQAEQDGRSAAAAAANKDHGDETDADRPPTRNGRSGRRGFVRRIVDRAVSRNRGSKPAKAEALPSTQTGDLDGALATSRTDTVPPTDHTPEQAERAGSGSSNDAAVSSSPKNETKDQPPASDKTADEPEDHKKETPVTSDPADTTPAPGQEPAAPEEKNVPKRRSYFSFMPSRPGTADAGDKPAAEEQPNKKGEETKDKNASSK